MHFSFHGFLNLGNPETGPLKMPINAISENPKFSKFLSGPFSSFFIRKRDMGSDLNNFYPDDGYGLYIYIFITFKEIGILRAQFCSISFQPYSTCNNKILFTLHRKFWFSAKKNLKCLAFVHNYMYFNSLTKFLSKRESLLECV